MFLIVFGLLFPTKGCFVCARTEWWDKTIEICVKKLEFQD